jgi:methionyl-tRNA formyltransferase
MSEARAPAAARLRVLFVTEDDPLYVIRFFEVFFAECPREAIEVCAITVDRAFHEPILDTARRMLRFYGPVGFVRLGARFALAKVRAASIEKLAREAGIAVLPTASVNDPEYVRRVRDLAPDVIVSVAAPEIFRKEILASAPKGCINIHSGRLPKYRGMMPNFWQLLNGEPHATVTVHEMAAKLDAGDVIATLEVPLRERDSLDRVIVETKRAGARLMIDVLRGIAAGTTRRAPLDMSEAEYHSFPKPEDVRAFRRRGHRML